MKTNTTTDAAKMVSVSEKSKRSIQCPECLAGIGKACRSSRQPGANTFGGGWGGPPDLDRAHGARRDAYLARKAAVSCHAAPGPKSLDLFYGPTVTIEVNPDAAAPERLQRAFALVCPKAWGRVDWKAEVKAVLHPADLAAALVTIGDVVEAVAFYTATPCGVREVEINAEPGVMAHVVFADGYRKGPAQ